MKKILWLEDQFEDLISYSSSLGRIGFLVDIVPSISETVEKLKEEIYAAYIFDLKVLPGDDPQWKKLDEKKRKENPMIEPLLGVELLRRLNVARNAQDELWQAISFDFNNVIIFSVVNDKSIADELESFSIPPDQILYKSDSRLDTLAEVVAEMTTKRIDQN